MAGPWLLRGGASRATVGWSSDASGAACPRPPAGIQGIRLPADTAVDIQTAASVDLAGDTFHREEDILPLADILPLVDIQTQVDTEDKRRHFCPLAHREAEQSRMYSDPL